MNTVFMFPGQGAQSIGMMSDLLAASDIASQVFEEASDAISTDLKKIALDGPEELINSTAITQPIVLTASLAMWKVWCEQSEIRPDAVCGHSLGEYSALVASEVLGFQDAVKLVHLRGQLMQDAVPHGEGAMAALLGIENDAVVDVCERAAQGEIVSPANYNSPGQVVISGSIAALERAIELAKASGARRAAILPVSVPCHCALLEPAGEALAAAMEEVVFREPVIPVMQNVNATIPANLAELRKNLLAHLHQPVRWSDSILKLAEDGANFFVECGPGKILTGLNKRIVKGVPTMSMSDQESMQLVIDQCRNANDGKKKE